MAAIAFLSSDGHIIAHKITTERLQAVFNGGRDFYDTTSEFQLLYDYLDGLHVAFAEFHSIMVDQAPVPEDLEVTRRPASTPDMTPNSRKRKQLSDNAAASLQRTEVSEEQFTQFDENELMLDVDGTEIPWTVTIV